MHSSNWGRPTLGAQALVSRSKPMIATRRGEPFTFICGSPESGQNGLDHAIAIAEYFNIDRRVIELHGEYVGAGWAYPFEGGLFYRTQLPDFGREIGEYHAGDAGGGWTHMRVVGTAADQRFQIVAQRLSRTGSFFLRLHARRKCVCDGFDFGCA